MDRVQPLGYVECESSPALCIDYFSIYIDELIVKTRDICRECIYKICMSDYSDLT